jgi:prephenate dehydrogenase
MEMAEARTTAGIVGLGLIGGSLGLALQRAGGWRVAGFDVRLEVSRSAVAIGACAVRAESLEEIARSSDLIVVAVPSSLIPEVALELALNMRPGAVLTDVGSVKLPLVRQISAGLPPGVQYVAGHPMAGSEKSGLGAASADLFEGAVWVLASENAGHEAVSLVESMVRAAGARPLLADPLDHDRAVAFASHLPYIVSLCLALASRDEAQSLSLVQKLQASGFRDTTRVARSEPSIAMDSCTMNRDVLVRAVDAFEHKLEVIKAALQRGEQRLLFDLAIQAKEYLASPVQAPEPAEPRSRSG